MPIVERDPECGWCIYHESDGHCTCKRQCSDCGFIYQGIGDHTREGCIVILKSRLTVLEWQLITPENLPHIGDELGCFLSDGRGWTILGYIKFVGFDTAEYITKCGWTHFRPINPPK